MAQTPNIVLVLVDDMGYGDFGIFSDGSSRTPALDALSTESVCFTQHYSGSCVCAPARASLMTGRYPHRTGAIDTLEGRGLDRLSLGETTMADVLGNAGYATGLFGKWHLGAIDSRYHPNARGFQEFAGFRGGWQDYYQWRLDQNGNYATADGRYLTEVITDEAVDFIDRHAAEPFFLHVTYNAPHFPFQAPERYVKPFRDTGRFTEAVSTLYGMIWAMDEGVQRILDTLDARGLRENTIFIFTSDNGPQMGGEGEKSTVRYNCGYHGAKGSTYEGGIRVPLMLRWPAGLDRVGACDNLAHFTDWLPTLAHCAGVELPHNLALDGIDLLPALRGEVPHEAPRRFWQWNRYTPVGTCNAAVRDGDWKLVRPAIRQAMFVSQADLDMDNGLKYRPNDYPDIVRGPDPEREIPASPPVELYNMALDPLERENLATEHPDVAHRLLCELETWFEEVEAERQAIDE